jgi:serine/threonine-protein phosphatase 2A regulatory subunit A
LQTLGEALPAALLSTRLLQSILSYASDPVPNIRFNVAKILMRYVSASKLEAASLAAVRNALSTMCSDKDDDVRFFASKAVALARA